MNEIIGPIVQAPVRAILGFIGLPSSSHMLRYPYMEEDIGEAQNSSSLTDFQQNLHAITLLFRLPPPSIECATIPPPTIERTILDQVLFLF